MSDVHAHQAFTIHTHQNADRVWFRACVRCHAFACLQDQPGNGNAGAPDTLLHSCRVRAKMSVCRAEAQ